MHVIAARTIRDYAREYAIAREPLEQWLETTEHSHWKNVNDVLANFPKTDSATVASGRTAYVFNIKGNAFRLIAAIHLNRSKVFILEFMTHAQYSKNSWKARL